MKLVRFDWQGDARWGVVQGEKVCALEGELWSKDMAAGAELAALADIKILAPVPRINKAIGIGLAYKDMYKNYSMQTQGVKRIYRDGPAVFMKPSNTIAAHEEPIVYLDCLREAIYEAECGVIISKRASRVKAEDAMDYVGGYTCVNDLTGTDFDTVEQPIVSTRFKIVDQFCPCGPFVETDMDPANIEVIMRVNGREEQYSRTGRDMSFTIAEEIEWVTSFMTLEPGDMISTGAQGTGRVEIGDVMEVEIPGVGTLRNPIGKFMFRAMQGGRETDAIIEFIPEMEGVVDQYELGNDYILNNATTLILACADKVGGFPQVNANLALQNAMLAAEAMGMGTFYAGFVTRACGRGHKIATLVGLPETHMIYGIVAVGHPRVKYRRWPDRNLAKVTWLGA